MTIPRRQRRLRGRHALVDGIAFDMPVNSQHSPALMAAFTVDADRAAELLPGGEVHPVRLPRNRGVLLITVIDYRTTDIGKYVEFSVALACTRGARPAPMLLPGLFRRLFGTGQFVLDLPVSSEVSVKGGKGIWGMPKHQANLDFVITDEVVSSQYDKDGLLAVKIEIDRPRMARLPVSLGAVNYCAFRGMLMKSSIYFKGALDVAFGPQASARLYLGDHPRADPLRRLDVSSRPLFTAFLEDSQGVLDDHYEGWFLTYDQPPVERPEGLEAVVDLGLGQEWLDPPKASVTASQEAGR
ncbi:MAG: acetoacetate decarboxylase family protein [Actinomycetota bacterium]|nr:acetoacetate decarboxylase family protein [Actinomycetota bacterium]